MSFIFGIVDFNKNPVIQDEIETLGKAVKWDNFIIQTKVDHNVAVGYCHHPERASKAKIFKGEELIVLADIRLYNTEELRKSIDFSTPEEAFANAYLRWGLQCVNHINGDFAAVVIDRKKNNVHLFRDHIGTRPLIYSFQENRLIFASHEFGLIKSGLVTTSLSEKKLIDQLFRFKGDYSQTVFQNIFKVVPGHYFSFSSNQKQITRYWNPRDIRKNQMLTFDDTVKQLQQLIVKATLNRTEPGKTGVHVSGGIDSTGIASILADHIEDKTQLTGYSWTPEKFIEPFEGINEKEYIETFSQEKGIYVKYLNLEANESIKDSILPEFEEMSIEHPTMKMAGKDEVRTLFSGYGGDEFVSLSNRGVYNYLFFSFKWIALKRFIVKSGTKSGIMGLLKEVFPLLIPFGLIHPYKAQYTDWSVLRLLKPSFVLKHWKQIIFHSRKNIFGYGNRTRFMLNLLENYHLPERIDSWAIHAERYGFAYKYPLLDKELLEFWFSIPVEYTYSDSQSRLLYRKAMKSILTEKIRIRPNKAEGQRISYTKYNRQLGDRYVKQLFADIAKAEHLPFFRPREIQKVIDCPSLKGLKEIRRRNKPIFYLRYVALIKKYFPSLLTISFIVIPTAS